jgi:hypothetical protein
VPLEPCANDHVRSRWKVNSSYLQLFAFRAVLALRTMVVGDLQMLRERMAGGSRLSL